jgi:hypothetical protein
MQNQPTTTPIIQLDDIEKIRELLPCNWRQLVRVKYPTLTPRQITEAFGLRTKNPLFVVPVFNLISETLVRIEQNELAKKCQQWISVCRLGETMVSANPSIQTGLFATAV